MARVFQSPSLPVNRDDMEYFYPEEDEDNFKDMVVLTELPPNDEIIGELLIVEVNDQEKKLPMIVIRNTKVSLKRL